MSRDRGSTGALREAGVEVRCFNPARTRQSVRLAHARSPEDARRRRPHRFRDRSLSQRPLGRAMRRRDIEPVARHGRGARGPRARRPRIGLRRSVGHHRRTDPRFRSHAAGLHRASWRHGAACHRHGARHHRRLPPRPHDVVPGAEDTLAHRCLLRRDADVRAGAVHRRARWRGRAPARARIK